MNYTYRIYPDASQQAVMLEWLEFCRRVYNFALRELKDWISSRKCPIDRCSLEKEYIIPACTPFPSYLIQTAQLPKIKEANPKLKQVHSQVLQDVIKRLHNTWENFQKRGFGFPRFKKFGQYRSFLFPQFKDNPITGHHIKLPKIGNVLINQHRPIPERFVVNQVRVLSRARGTQWYVNVCIQSDVTVPDAPVHGRVIGIDLGLERFLTTSDGLSVERPKFFKSMHRRLKVLQRRAAKKQKRSKNWERALQKVAKFQHHIANARKDFHFKTAHQLCDQAETIFAESLNVKGLVRGMLRKECLDAAFGQFLSILEWVCWKRGAYFAQVDAAGTSQTCPHCGAHTPKDLSVRVHQCGECGYTCHRDCAAGQMVLIRGLEQAVPVDVRGKEIACEVVLSGVFDLDKWRSAGSLKGDLGSSPTLYA